MGQTFESLPAFGRDVLENCGTKTSHEYSYYTSILRETSVAIRIDGCPKNEKLKKAAGSD